MRDASIRRLNETASSDLSSGDGAGSAATGTALVGGTIAVDTICPVLRLRFADLSLCLRLPGMRVLDDDAGGGVWTMLDTRADASLVDVLANGRYAPSSVTWVSVPSSFFIANACGTSSRSVSTSCDTSAGKSGGVTVVVCTTALDGGGYCRKSALPRSL